MENTDSLRQRRWPLSFRSRHLRFRPLALMLISTFFLIGCRDAGAPTFSLFGSWFPLWLACAGVGIIAAILARVLLIFAGIDDVLPCRLLVYVCVALAGAFLSLLLFNLR